MQGRKPRPPSNVIPMAGAKAPRPSPAVLARKLCPRGLTKDERKEWNRVATLLAAPNLDRLQHHFVDTVAEYCRASIRLRDLRQFFVDLTAANKLKRQAAVPLHTAVTDSKVECEHPLGAEVYEVEGRNGAQLKTHPLVAQLNETWRQWRSLMMELGLSPASERNLIPGQGDLFNDPAEGYLGGGS
jgi:P27 family predicted phage terminase small subunit